MYASLVAAAACGGGDLVLPGGGGPSELTILDGDGQRGAAGSLLADPLVVRAIDAQERGIPGIRVVFEPGPGGSVAPDTAVTGDDGRATALWTLGTAAGAQELEARVAGSASTDLAAEFAASATPGAAQALAVVSGVDQSAPVGTALPDSLVVAATDQFGNPVAGVMIHWNATTGSIAPEAVETGVDGRAGSRRILGSAAGLQSATAEAAGLEGSPITFNHSALSGAAASLVLISGHDQSGAPGAELPLPLVVRLVDEAGNGTGGRPVSWIVAPGSGSVATTTSETDKDGFASARWTLSEGTGTKTLSAVASGVGVVEFQAFAVAGGAGQPDHLVFRVQPSTEEEDQRLSPPVEVAVVDRDGNTVAVSDVRIRIALVASANQLKGDREEDTQAGVAVFDDLKIDRDGEGYVLVASAPELPELGSVESVPFEITDR
jgi:hypothetical protein